MAAQSGLKLDAAPVRVSGWAVLTLDGLRLALPQRDIVSLELASGLRTSPVGNVEVGTFVQNNSTWPVYALDAALTLQATGVTRRLCAFFQSSGPVQGILFTPLFCFPATATWLPKRYLDAWCTRIRPSPVTRCVNIK